MFADRVSVCLFFFGLHFSCFSLLQKEEEKTQACQGGYTPMHCANLEMGFTSPWSNVSPPAASALAAAEFVKLSATLHKHLSQTQTCTSLCPQAISLTALAAQK